MPESTIFKIIHRHEWAEVADSYAGSAHDAADGFLHFSTRAQLPDTLRLYYAGQDGLMLIAVNAAALGDALRYEYSGSRDQDFPHLFAPLPRSAVLWAAPISRLPSGEFLLPPEQDRPHT